MRFAKNLYIGESIGRNKRLVMWKLMHGAGMLMTYVIVLNENGSDPLEIYHNSVLRQSYFRKHPPFVVGLAGSFEEAARLSWTIISDSGFLEDPASLRSFFIAENSRPGVLRGKER